MAERDTGQRAVEEVKYARRLASENAFEVASIDAAVIAVLLGRILDELQSIRATLETFDEYGVARRQ